MEDKEAVKERAVQWFLAQLEAQGSPATEAAYDELGKIVETALAAIAEEDPELLQALTQDQIVEAIQQVVENKTT
jgi:hypothetical protein